MIGSDVLKTLAAACVATGLGSAAAVAQNIDPNGPYFNTLTCDPIFDVNPDATACYGAVGGGNTNAQQVGFNTATFYSGSDTNSASTIGLFGKTNWFVLQSDPNVNGGKNGTFTISDFGSQDMAVLLKGGPTWSAYRFTNGVSGDLEYDLTKVLGAGLSNYVVLGTIPLPAGAWLMIAAFGGLGVAREVKKRRAA